MFNLYGQPLTSHLFLGTAGFPSPSVLSEAIEAAAVEWVTLTVPPPGSGHTLDDLDWDWIGSVEASILPATAGCRTAAEAAEVAAEARDAFQTSWIKLHVEPEGRVEPRELVAAARRLAGSGFQVLPVLPPDPELAAALVEAGSEALLVLASEPASGQGLLDRGKLIALRDRFEDTALIIAGGLGRPSHAADAMELGYDGVHVTTAIAQAGDPVGMAEAFANAVDAGLSAYTAGLMEPDGDTAGEADLNRFWEV